MIRHFDRQLVDRAPSPARTCVIWKPPSPTIAQTFLRGLRELRADRGREAEAHRAGAAATRSSGGCCVVEAELRGPHLVLADVGGDDRVALRERVQPVEHVLRAQAALLRVLERVLLAPARRICVSHSAVSQPARPAGAGPRSRAARRRRIDTSGCTILLNSAGSMSMWIFTASVQNSLELAGDAVVPARADRHDQVAVGDRLVGVGGAVHAEHARGAAGASRRPRPCRAAC